MRPSSIDLRLKCFMLFFLADLDPGRCTKQKHRSCMFTVKHQMSGEEFIRDFYIGGRILKISHDHHDWPLYQHWSENTSDLQGITISYKHNTTQEISNLKDLKLSTSQITLEKEITLSQHALLDLIPTPIAILSCRDLFYEFQEGVEYTLYFTNEENCISMNTTSVNSWWMILSGELQTMTLKNCHQTFNSGELLYIPQGFDLLCLKVIGKFFAIKMAWKPVKMKHRIRCNGLTLRSLKTRECCKKSTTIPPEFMDRHLNTGFKIPSIGLGDGSLGNNKFHTLKKALEVGYKLFDISKTKTRTKNRQRTAGLFSRALQETKTRREDIFISTRILLETGSEKYTIKTELSNRLYEIGSDYIDLVILELPIGVNHTFLIHKIKNAWEELLQAKNAGWTHNLGLSNVHSIQELDEINELQKDGLSVVQNWFDLLHTDNEVRLHCKVLKIVYMAYGVLGFHRMKMEKMSNNPILTSPVVTKLAQSVHLPKATLLLQWAMNKGIVVTPSTSDSYHLESNLYSKQLHVQRRFYKKLDKLSIRDISYYRVNNMGLKDNNQKGSEQETLQHNRDEL